MYLKQLTISNYKSFYKPQVMNFEPGFNVLLGANSSGKSSVLEAIAFQDFGNIPHRSILNILDKETQTQGGSISELSFVSNINEVSRSIPLGQPLYIGIGDHPNRFHSQDKDQLTQRVIGDSLHLDIRKDHLSGDHMRIGFSDWPPVWRHMQSMTQIAAFVVPNTGEPITKRLQLAEVLSPNTNANDLAPLFTKTFQKIFKFSSERPIRSTSAHHYTSAELSTDCSNLAFCINLLQTTRSLKFDELNKLLHQIFPTIYNISAYPTGNNQFELIVHMYPNTLDRHDLAVPINLVGTGVFNALAMLYVALTAETPRLILLEEPNSYLHPRALRELLAILAEIGNKHQYFVTTHSSDVLRTIKAATVTLLEYDGQQTTTKQTTGDTLHDLKAGLIDLGINLTDLHGCDRVLWVEGETEEAVFPLLLRHFFSEIAQGIAVLVLHATGDFESRKIRPEKVAQIYKKLSQDSFLAPPMVAIALDRESKPASLIAQIEKDSDGTIHFLPKTMLEDYLLDAEAIAAILSEQTKIQVTIDQVNESLIAAKASNDCLLNPQNTNSRDEFHAAKLLSFVFSTIGKEVNLDYHKTSHGPQIVEWLLANKQDALLPLKDWLHGLLEFMRTQK